MTEETPKSEVRSPNFEDLRSALVSRLGDRAVLEVTRPTRAWLRIKLEDLAEVAQWLKQEFGYYHCSTVTGLDSGEVFEVLYHLSAGGGELTLRFTVPRTNPHFPTMTGVWPGAILYERELQDMFGMVVDGHPDPRRYVLPEDWPDRVYPLRKDYVYTYQEAPPAKRDGE